MGWRHHPMMDNAGSLVMTLSLLLIVITSNGIQSSNILLVPASGEGSHSFIMSSIAKELVSRGHNITMLMSEMYRDKHAASNNDQERRFNFAFFKSNFTLSDMHEIIAGITDAALHGEYLTYMMELLGTDFMLRHVDECAKLLGDRQLMAAFRDSNVSLAVVDSSFLCPIGQYLKQDQGVPYVALSALSTRQSAVLLFNRSPYNPSYMPEFTSGSSDRLLSFSDRLYNSIFATFLSCLTLSFANPFEDIKKQHGISHMSSEHTDAELWLVNTHFAFDFPRPLLPNTIAVGGLTTKPSKPLKQDWEDILQGAGDEGVVLFSLGSYATGLDDNIANLFSGAFAQLSQTVIWKLNGDVSANLTPNVKVVDWMPQNDLLGHPHVKAFVTHCGMNSVWEAVYHGVPVVAIPMFADQPDNAARIVSRGMGIKVDITTLTSDVLAEAIKTVTKDPSYKANATRISKLFRDTRRQPTELAADWLEYVIRHGDARHLRSAALDLSVFQYLLLDVVGVILVAFTVLGIVLLNCCRVCVRGCRSLCGRSGKMKRE